MLKKWSVWLEHPAHLGNDESSGPGGKELDLVDNEGHQRFQAEDCHNHTDTLESSYISHLFPSLFGGPTSANV